MSLLDPAFSRPEFKWNERTARHLLNRAGFGVPPMAIVRLAAMKPQEAVSAFVDYERLPDVAPAAPSDLPQRFNYRELRQTVATMSEEEKRQFRQEKQKEAREAMVGLESWWITRMRLSQRPLEEKLALFWHGHFATSAEKVKEPQANLQLNQIFRSNASANFDQLTRAVGKSPAMMRYLDQIQSTRQKPNENWARELMELFTLGIGNYTENDIKEAARAFTGWADRDGQYFFDSRRHDTDNKTFLGQTGNFDGDKIISIIMQQPACAEFISRKLWKFFAYDEPEQEVVTGLAETLRKNKYELKPLLRQMFSSEAFYSDRAMHSQVKSPSQLVVNLMVQLNAPLEAKPPVAQLAMRAMGQALFFPPNVKGWDGGKAWINTNTLLIRYNFANYLVSGVVPSFGGFGKGGGALKQGAKFLARLDGNGNGDAESMSNMDGMATNPGMNDENMRPDVEKNAPAGQDAMPRDIPSSSLYTALQKQRGANAFETRAMQRAPFKAREFFKQFQGKTSDEIIDGLTAYFIGFPLEPAQREKLKNVMAQAVPPGKPVPVDRVAEEDLRATVQLLLSTAEYQVC
ncbi:MAG: DUF1800 domain-containing protein [Candidatus Sumerlaeaceae bacterium]